MGLVSYICSLCGEHYQGDPQREGGDHPHPNEACVERCLELLERAERAYDEADRKYQEALVRAYGGEI